MTRRHFLVGVGATAVATSTASIAGAAPIDDVLATPAVDLHSHAGGRLVSGQPRYNLAEKMRQGRFSVVTMATIADQTLLRRDGLSIKAIRKPMPGELFAHVQRQLDAIDGMIADYGLARILKPDDVVAGRPGVLVAVEGADFLEGDLSRVKWAYDRGVRHLQLVHYRVNELGDIMTQDPVHGGLTEFGAAVVRECNRLGIIIDVAHASAAVNFKVVELSTTPDQAKAILGKGGIIGLWPAGAVFRNIDVWAGGLANMVKNWGADAVAIGSDMEGGIEEVFNDYSAYPKVVEALMAKGLSAGDVTKIVGGNHMRVFKAVTAAAVS